MSKINKMIAFKVEEYGALLLIQTHKIKCGKFTAFPFTFLLIFLCVSLYL